MHEHGCSAVPWYRLGGGHHRNKLGTVGHLLLHLRTGSDVAPHLYQSHLKARTHLGLRLYTVHVCRVTVTLHGGGVESALHFYSSYSDSQTVVRFYSDFHLKHYQF